MSTEKRKNNTYKFHIRSRKIQLVADKLLFLDLFEQLRGRFWGIYGLLVFDIALGVCFIIRPELRDASAAFSDFGKDPRTAPYFTAGLIACAYGLWRWRNYVGKTSKNPGLTTLGLTTTIAGIYMVALAPIGWNKTIDTIHFIGVGIMGVGIASTVTFDMLLRKTKSGKRRAEWQLVRLLSLALIMLGLTITLLSMKSLSILELPLVGESIALAGYALWVLARTYQGEGTETNFARALKKVLIID